MLKRLTAFMLAAMILVSCIPFTAFASGYGADVNAGGTSSVGNIVSGGGTLTDYTTGYRFYLVDADTSKRVSRVLDLVYGQPYGSINCTGTKFDSGNTFIGGSSTL